MAVQNTQLSLSEIVKEVAQQQQQQAIETEKNKNILSHMQAKLFEMERENKAVLQKFRATENQIYHLQNESENQRQSCAELEAQLWSLNANNLQLKFDNQEEEQKYFKLLSDYYKYRKKMAAHKEITNQLENRTPIMMQLEEKLLMVKDLKAKKEELASDLVKPEGNKIKQVQGEIAELKAKISEIKIMINDKSVQLIKEQEHYIHLKKEIEAEVVWSNCQGQWKIFLHTKSHQIRDEDHSTYRN
ncbi:coiled-coil domain-containing protein 122 isoform X2 [Narcine bancroftii]|uniref:coiled-coil domain-containing protein 122 isoform X2 n=1 Tax=Narcine bancroftii TaxID=1343680 RepID=UPI003831D405